MGIRFTAGAPTDTHDRMHNWAHELPLTDAGGAEPMRIAEAYQVHFLSADRIAEGNLLEAAHARRWRHLVMEGERVHAELELDESAAPIALHEGPGKDGLRAALEVAEGMDGDFEASVLQATPLRFVALWLHADAEDWVIPYAPNMTELQNYDPVTVADALEVLQPIAAAVLEMSAGDEPTGG